MSLTLLDIQHLRNLTNVKLHPSPKFNLFYGKNGSGKTSILEAVHYLAIGRSFRSRLATRLIQEGTDHFSIFSQIQQSHVQLSAGIERRTQGEKKIRVNSENAKSIVEIMKVLPVRFIHSESRSLLTGSSKMRRQFLDWGVFHVEPTFLQYWQRAEIALKQRNAALKSHLPRKAVQLWENELLEPTEILNTLRWSYMQAFEETFQRLIPALLPNTPISITYHPGWNEKMNIQEAWEHTFARDFDLGYTQHGHHRADMIFRINQSVPVQDILSQGQQKLLVYALYLTQGILLREKTDKQCVYLLDDLPAELDMENQRRVIDLLEQIDAQSFITGVEKETLASMGKGREGMMFHVEHGSVTEEKT